MGCTTRKHKEPSGFVTLDNTYIILFRSSLDEAKNESYVSNYNNNKTGM